MKPSRFPLCTLPLIVVPSGEIISFAPLAASPSLICPVTTILNLTSSFVEFLSPKICTSLSPSARTRAGGVLLDISIPSTVVLRWPWAVIEIMLPVKKKLSVERGLTNPLTDLPSPDTNSLFGFAFGPNLIWSVTFIW